MLFRSVGESVRRESFKNEDRDYWRFQLVFDFRRGFLVPWIYIQSSGSVEVITIGHYLLFVMCIRHYPRMGLGALAAVEAYTCAKDEGESDRTNYSDFFSQAFIVLHGHGRMPLLCLYGLTIKNQSKAIMQGQSGKVRGTNPSGQSGAA